MTDFDSVLRKQSFGDLLRSSRMSLALSLIGGAISASAVAQSSSPALTDSSPPVPNRSDAQAVTPAGIQTLDSITISATRRREPAREVPMQVDTLSTEKIQQSGAKSLSEYLGDQPGVDVKTGGGAGTGSINVRGVSTGDQTISTVGVYVDDVAIGSSTAYAQGASTAFDMSLLDLNHIELLRGPQGTLYGAGAMGGLLKYVTNQPNTFEFAGKVSVGGTLTKGGEAGSTFSAVVNVPLKEDVAGLRISAFRDNVGGYIDAVGPAGGSNINGGHTTGGRISLLVDPSDRFTIKLSAMQQEIKRDGLDYVDYDINTNQPLHGPSTRLLSLREPYNVKTKVASADLEYDFGWARLNSITSTQQTDLQQRSDYSAVYGPAVGLDTVAADLHTKADRTTQEFRLTSQTGKQIEWIAGLYYNHEKGSNVQTDTGLTPGDLLTADIPSRYTEKAFYGDVTWNATDRIAITTGARVARNNQSYVVAGDGLLIGGPLTLVGSSEETSKTYLFTAKYALTPTSNIYTRIASGYRPGGPNPVLRDANGNALVPPSFQHDSLWSYEGGYKADLLDKSLSIQGAVYDIRWSQIQQFFAVNGVNVIVNGGRAEIKGAELSTTWRPTTHWSVGGSVAYNDARLTDDAPGLALAGTRLPNTARFSANLSMNYGFALAGRAAYVGFTQRLVGSRDAGFAGSSTLPSYRLPGYGLTDLQAGVDLNRFQIAFFVRNIFDKRAQLDAETNLVTAGVGGPVQVLEARPITVGATLTAKF